jgi:TRAP-type mannitol/chloroaromatic compound transport system permease small subunit
MTTTRDLRTGIRAFDFVADLLDRLTALMSVVGTLGIIAIMLLIVVDVGGRFFFGRPIAGVPEIVAMSILGIVFLQIANTLARGKLTRTDAFLGFIGRRSPRAALAVDAAMHIAGGVLIAILVNAFYPLFMRSYTRGDAVGSVGQFMAPIWPTHLIVLVGSFVLLLVFAMRALALILLAVRGAPDAEPS